MPYNLKFALIAIALLTALCFAGPVACTSSKSTTRTLQAAGYSSIEITGWRPFAKSKGDWYSTGFKATGPTGVVVTGTVTGGLLFKGNTIRTD